MAVKRTLPQPSNPNKKAKVEVAVSVEELKESFANKSEKSGTVVLGRKTFDLALLGSMADILLEELPSFEFAKEDGEEASAAYSIVFTQQFSEEQMRLLVDKLELNGAACVLYGEKQVRMQGFVLWTIGVKLKTLYPYLKTSETERGQSILEKRVLNGKREAETLEELNNLLPQRRKHWSTQALLKSIRIFKKHNCFSNYFIFDTSYRSLLKGWQEKKLTHENVFLKVLLFIEMFNSRLLKKEILDEESEKLMMSVLQDLQQVIFRAPNVNFENMMTCLSFAARFNLQSLGKQKEGVSLHIILTILKRLVQFPARDEGRVTSLMKKYLESYEKILATCVAYHYAFLGLRDLEMEPVLQHEQWMPQLRVLLGLTKREAPYNPKSLLCLTATKVISLKFSEQSLSELPTNVNLLLQYH